MKGASRSKKSRTNEPKKSRGVLRFSHALQFYFYSLINSSNYSVSNFPLANEAIQKTPSSLGA